jgi:hypothetical protein
MRSPASAECPPQKARPTTSSATAPILTRITAIYPLQAPAPVLARKFGGTTSAIRSTSRPHDSATEPRESVRALLDVSYLEEGNRDGLRHRFIKK